MLDSKETFDDLVEQIARNYYDDNKKHGRDKNGTEKIPHFVDKFDIDQDKLLTAFLRDHPVQASDAILNEYFLTTQFQKGILDDYLEKSYFKLCDLLDDDE